MATISKFGPQIFETNFNPGSFEGEAKMGISSTKEIIYSATLGIYKGVKK